MERFQDINIFCESESDAEALLRIARRLTELQSKWMIDEDEMQRSLRTDYGQGRGFLCVDRLNNDRSPMAVLTLLHNPTQRVYIPNIVPRVVGKLSIAKYNEILQSFNSEILQPSLKDLNKPYRFEMTKAVIGIDDVFPAELAKRLRFFSEWANKTLLHPYDQERWRDFLIASHQSKHEVASDVLCNLLVEELNWPDDDARELAIEYDQGLELLRAYDQSEPS